MNSRQVTGAYMDGYALCVDCAHELHTEEVLLTEWAPIYAGTEWEAPGPVCDNCHELIECSVIEVEVQLCWIYNSVILCCECMDTVANSDVTLAGGPWLPVYGFMGYDTMPMCCACNRQIEDHKEKENDE